MGPGIYGSSARRSIISVSVTVLPSSSSISNSTFICWTVPIDGELKLKSLLRTIIGSPPAPKSPKLLLEPIFTLILGVWG